MGPGLGQVADCSLHDVGRGATCHQPDLTRGFQLVVRLFETALEIALGFLFVQLPLFSWDLSEDFSSARPRLLGCLMAGIASARLFLMGLLNGAVSLTENHLAFRT
jgi:hypothetical protein